MQFNLVLYLSNESYSRGDKIHFKSKSIKGPEPADWLFAHFAKSDEVRRYYSQDTIHLQKTTLKVVMLTLLSKLTIFNHLIHNRDFVSLLFYVHLLQRGVDQQLYYFLLFIGC